MITFESLKTLLISPELGVIQSLALKPHPFCPGLQVGLSLSTRGQKKFVSSAIDFSDDLALLKATMESVERYSTAIKDRRTFISGRAEDLKYPTFNTKAFNLELHDQNGASVTSPLPHKEETNWVKAIDLNNKHYYVPASAAYLVKSHASDYLPTSSSGCAAHLYTPGAQLNALLENIERDSFTNHWRTGLAPKKIEISSSKLQSPYLKKLLHYLPSRKFKTEFFLLESEFNTCTILAASFGLDPRWPALVVSAASHPNKETTLLRTLYELYLVYYLFYIKTFGSINFAGSCPILESKIFDFEMHANYYYYYENLEKLGNFFRSESVLKFEDLKSFEGNTPANIELIQRSLERHGYHPLFFNHTTCDVAMAGIEVWRSIVPGLSMINASNHCIPLTKERLHKFYNTFSENSLSRFTINRKPHFFP